LLLDTHHCFFQQRGLSAHTLQRFEAGVWHGRGFLEGMAAVRLFDLRGLPLGYAGRRLDSEAARRHGKWKWPSAFPKSTTLYNWHRAWPQAERGLIVVEGVWSVMKLAQAGFPNAVALGGTAVSATQAGWLRGASRLVLILDGDSAGRDAMTRLEARHLHPKLQTIALPPGVDPADLPEQKLRQLLSTLFP
jgi:DNA primase